MLKWNASYHMAYSKEDKNCCVFESQIIWADFIKIWWFWVVNGENLHIYNTKVLSRMFLLSEKKFKGQRWIVNMKIVAVNNTKPLNFS